MTALAGLAGLLVVGGVWLAVTSWRRIPVPTSSAIDGVLRRLDPGRVAVAAGKKNDAKVLLDQIVIRDRVIIEHEHERARYLRERSVSRETLTAFVLPDDSQVEVRVALVRSGLARFGVVLVDDDYFPRPHGLAPERL